MNPEQPSPSHSSALLCALPASELGAHEKVKVRLQSALSRTDELAPEGPKQCECDMHTLCLDEHVCGRQCVVGGTGPQPLGEVGHPCCMGEGGERGRDKDGALWRYKGHCRKRWR
jgi:hypothetical protein